MNDINPEARLIVDKLHEAGSLDDAIAFFSKDHRFNEVTLDPTWRFLQFVKWASTFTCKSDPLSCGMCDFRRIASDYMISVGDKYMETH